MTNKPDTVSQQDEAVRNAFASFRSSLRLAPAFLAVIAMAAGMAPTQAKAWGSDFENLGRVIGGEAGRQAAGGGHGPNARIGGLIGEVIGKRVARPADEAEREANRIADIERQAREQAVRDTAYETQRRKIDPNYRSMGERSSQSNLGNGSGLGQSSARIQQLVNEMNHRNYPRQR